MSIITAHKGTEWLTVTFEALNPDLLGEYTVDGSATLPELLLFLNDVVSSCGTHSGLPDMFTGNDTPREVINALRYAGFNVVLPEEWENMDDPDPEEDDTGSEGTEREPEVM